jgi:hypothetical protein
MCAMHGREPPRGVWPAPQGERAPGPTYAPETWLVPGTLPIDHDEVIRALVIGLPDGAGPLQRIGICNAGGDVYREVTLHGPVQLIHLWARLNALGFRQAGPQGRGFSKYCLLFTRGEKEKRPLEGGRKQIPSG